MDNNSDNQKIDVYGYVITRGEYKTIINHVNNNTVPDQCKYQENMDGQYCKVYDYLCTIKLIKEHENRDYYDWDQTTRL